MVSSIALSSATKSMSLRSISSILIDALRVARECSLIMHNGYPTDHLVHADLPSFVQIRHPLLTFVNHIFHLSPHRVAHLLHCLQPRHLVANCRLAGSEILASLDEMGPAVLQRLQEGWKGGGEVRKENGVEVEEGGRRRFGWWEGRWCPELGGTGQGGSGGFR